MCTVLEGILDDARERVLDPDAKAVRRWRAAVRGRAVVGSHTRYFPTAMAEALGMLHVSHPAATLPLDVAFSADAQHPGAQRLPLPHDPEAPDAVAAWERELRRAGQLLEAACGRSLTPIYLRAALHHVEENRALMQRLMAMRSVEPQLLKFSEAALLVRLGNFLPRREHSAVLETVIRELDGRHVAAEPRLRVALVGLGSDAPPLEVLEEAEHADLYVVDDDLFLGERMAAIPRPDGGAFTVLAETYIHSARSLPAPWNPRRTRAEFVIKSVRASYAQAVLLALPSDSESALGEAEAIERALDQASIPHLLLCYDRVRGEASLVSQAFEATVR